MKKEYLKATYSLTLSSLLYSATLFAGGISLYEMGSDDVGLAAAGYSARAQDPSTILTNPAGMTRLEGTQLFLGAQALYEDIEYSPITNSAFLGSLDGGNPIRVVPGGSAFFHYSVTDRFKAGIGMYGNFGSMLMYHSDWVGRYSSMKSTLMGLSLQPTLAYRMSEGLSLGAGPVIMYGIFRAKTRINNTPFQIFNFHDGELKLSDYTWGVGANLGALYEFNDCTRVGLNYTSPIKLNFSPSAVFTDLSPILNTLLANRGLLNADVNIRIEVPQTAMFSLFHQWDPVWALLVSAGWQNWKKFGQIDVGIDSTNPVGLTIDKHNKDTWHGAVGIQHQLNEKVKFNGGIGFDSRFQSNEQIPVSTPVNSAWRFGIGTHFDVNKVIDAGVSAEYVWGGTMHVNNQGLVAGDYAGDFRNTAVYFLAGNINFKCPT